MSKIIPLKTNQNLFRDKAFPNKLTMSKCLLKNSISHQIISDTDIKVDHWKSPFFIDSYYAQKEAHIYFAHDVFGQKNHDICALESLSSEFTCERYDCNSRIFPNSVAIYFGCSIDLDFFNTDQNSWKRYRVLAKPLMNLPNEQTSMGLHLMVIARDSL